jgi:hypothetical protein
MLRQLVKFATTPESNLAINRPSISPDVTIARREAFRCAGAKSPTRGTISCGVTVVAPHTKDKARKTVKSFVTQSPIHYMMSAAGYSNMLQSLPLLQWPKLELWWTGVFREYPRVVEQKWDQLRSLTVTKLQPGMILRMRHWKLRLSCWELAGCSRGWQLWYLMPISVNPYWLFGVEVIN